ncbi:glycoside hydrolase family 66 protein [Paenibacillus rhizoplanae]
MVCTLLIEQPIECIYMASPDDQAQEVNFLDYEVVPHGQGLAARFTLPSLRIWSMVVVKFSLQE